MAYTQVEWQNGSTGGTPINATNLGTMDVGIKNLDDTITELKNDLYFKNGDTYTFPTDIYCAGVLTGSRQSVMCTIPLPKFATGLNVTLTSGIIYIRGTSGYLVNGQSFLNATRITVSNLGNAITVEFTYPTFTSASNNTPLSVAFRNLNISFASPSSES